MYIYCLSFKTIDPQYFYKTGHGNAALRPLEYIGNNWGELASNLSTNELRFEASTMITLQKDCSKQAREDLSKYTGAMASILNVKRTIIGCEAPVLDRAGWIDALVQSPTNEHLQKWIFAWMYVRSITKNW